MNNGRLAAALHQPPEAGACLTLQRQQRAEQTNRFNQALEPRETI